MFSCVSSLPWPASMVLFDVRSASRRQHSGATLALTFGRRNVLSADISATNVSRARPFGPHPLHCRGAETLEPQILLFIAEPFLGYAGKIASKCEPSFHMRPMRTASFLATATRARFGPTVLTSFRPQLRKANLLLTVVNSTLAAS